MSSVHMRFDQNFVVLAGTPLFTHTEWCQYHVISVAAI